jgi:hypothetical protein
MLIEERAPPDTAQRLPHCTGAGEDKGKQKERFVKVNKGERHGRVKKPQQKGQYE